MGASGSVTQLEHIPQHSMFKGSLVQLCPRVLVLEGRAFLQGTARLATHLVPCLCPWEDAAMLVTHARGRSLGLAALSLPGSAKFPLLAAPCPQNCSGMLTSWALVLELQVIPKWAVAGKFKSNCATRKLCNGPAHAQASPASCHPSKWQGQK